MGVLYARVGGAWVPVVSAGGGTNEVHVGPADPISSYPDTEVWYDSDAPAVLTPDLRWNTAWGIQAIAPARLSNPEPIVFNSGGAYLCDPVSFKLLSGRRYRVVAAIRAVDSNSVSFYMSWTNGFGGSMIPGANEAKYLNVTAALEYGGATHEWILNGDDVTYSWACLAKTNSASMAGVFHQSSFFYIEDVGPITQAATIPNPTPAWTNLTFIDANWRALNASSTWQTGYRKIGDRVEMRGLVQRLNSSTGAGGSNVAQMPAGFYAPGREAYFVVARTDTNTTGIAYFSSTGILSFFGNAPFAVLPANSWFSLDGISFSVAP